MHTAFEKNQEKFGNFDQMEMLSVASGDIRLLSDGNQSSIFLRGFCYGTFANDDKFSRNFFLSQLHLSVGIKIKELANIFDLQYQYCSAIIVSFKRDGLDGIKEKVRVNKGGRPFLITKKVGQEILRLREAGKSYKEVSQNIRFRFKKKIKESTLRTWVCNEKKKLEGKEVLEQVEMRVEPGLPAVAEELVIVDCEGEQEQENNNSYAGSMILYSMLAKSNFLKAFEENIKNNKDRPETWGVRRVLLTLFFLHALRLKSVEQGKHIVGKDFEDLVGGGFLRLQWLRYAVDEITKSDGFERALVAGYKNMILASDQGDRLYYTDGHFSTYYGKRPIPKGYDPRRQMPYRGRNTVYLHNSNGENIFLFESPTNTTLSNDIEVLMKSMDDFGMRLKGSTLCFDRGGWSAKCFKSIRFYKMYFISYLKNRKTERLVDESLFKTFVVEKEVGKPCTLRIFEKETKQTKYGTVRTIIILSEGGRQIPIITTNPHLKALDVVLTLKRRWKEENCFKYMTENFGIDLLTTYKTEDAPDKIITRPHPERKEVNRQLAEKKHELKKLKSELAVKLSNRGEKSEETIREFYEQEKELNFKIKNVQVDIDYLERKRKTIPTKEKRNLKDDHVIIASRRRLFINMVKAMNYNVEKWLQEIFENYHDKKDETLSLIRNLCRQPGRVIQTPSTVRVKLRPLDHGPMRESLDKVLEKLKKNEWLRMPDGRNLEIIQTH